MAIDAALDVEQRIDALDRFERDRRDRWRFVPTPSVGRDIRQLEELPSSVRPTQGGGNRSLRSRGGVQLVVAAVGVRLQDPGEVVKMPGGMLKATGRRMDAPCADVFELVDGKIKRFDCYPSGTVVLTQLGVLEDLSAAFE